ncbi:CvpA family protein [Chloroflexus sp.]|uniref:CvpA family protein n=1 Tax=Chloroflexus sp. TaxID=1904827 RepID=UPI00261091E6|nr:CvpA family protein [uncultured Chloroflexus sp.]
MLIDIGALAVIGFFGFIGLRRGAWPSGFILAGTLIGTVLVDLWQNGVIDLLAWVGLATGWPLFLALSGLLTLAIIVGYGIDVIAELGVEDAEEWSHRLVGTGIGLINAALTLTYLVKYAQIAWSEAAVASQLAASTVIPMVIELLPWGMLAITLLGLLILTLRLLHKFHSERMLYLEMPASPQEADRRVLDHVTQALERRRR